MATTGILWIRAGGVLVAGLLACAGALAASQGLRGMPLTQRYSAEDYRVMPVHLAVAPAPDGSVLVGNVEGLLRFDGTQWRLLELPQRSPARALAFGTDGRLYVGGYDQFGLVEMLPTGEMRYRDLRPAFGLSGPAANVADVWEVVATRTGVYFRTGRSIFFHGYDGATASWPAPAELRSLRPVGDALYSRIEGRGLVRFENGEFLPLPGAEAFASQSLFGIVGRGDGLLLVGEDGFYRADGAGIRRLPGEAGRLFRDHPPYAVLELADGSLAIGTFDGEVLRFDRELRLIARHRIGPYSVLALAHDREGGLWAATEGELLRLQLPSPWSAYTAEQGLVGAISDVAWHADTLWVANTLGVARAEHDRDGQTRFRQVLRTELESYDLESDRDGLLIAERNGLLLLPPGATEPQRLLELASAYSLRRCRFDSDRVLHAVGEEQLARLERGDHGWEPAAVWPLDGVAVYGMQQEGPGVLWLGDARGGPVRWTLSADRRSVESRRRFGADDGLVIDPQLGSNVVRLGDSIHVISGQRGFRWNGERFEPALSDLLERLQRPWELSIVDTRLGQYAFTSRELFHRERADGPWRPLHLASGLARGFTSVLENADGRLRIITWNALLQYDPEVEPALLPALAVSLRSLQLRAAGGDDRPLPTSPGSLPQPLPAGDSLRFDFSLVTMEPGAQIRYRIDGLIDEWSDWLPLAESTVTIRSLSPGEYRLEAEGRTPSGREVEPLGLAFAVSPRWYQSGWAMAAGVLLAIAIIAAIAQLIAWRRLRKFDAARRELECKVDERTRELAEANRRLAELATEDSLTGVANRRALEQALEREWQRCAELALPLAVIMIDVDRFKQFNDRHGHLAGDRQLRWVADRLAENVRPMRELLARFGGEEFAVVLPGLGLAEALERAERFRARFVQPDSGLTISAGVAVEVPAGERTPRDLVHDADQALYRAKQNGRNRVEHA